MKGPGSKHRGLRTTGTKGWLVCVCVCVRFLFQFRVGFKEFGGGSGWVRGGVRVCGSLGQF